MKETLLKPVLPKGIDSDISIPVIRSNIESMTENIILCKYNFKGVSQRTAFGDEIELNLKQKQDETIDLNFSLKRDSLYHILPEYLFHPLDFYLGIEGDSDEFNKRYKEQDDQKKTALIYFNPFDCILQQLRCEYQVWLNENIFSGNQFLSEFITNGYNVNLENKYIKAVYPCIYWLRDFRGNEEMIHVALGYAFGGNCYVEICKEEYRENFSEDIQSSVDSSMLNHFCGNSFCSEIEVLRVFYNIEINKSEELEILKKEINEFSDFFRDWFLSVESKLDIQFGDKNAAPILPVNIESKEIFLNYSAQLI